jgi:predicted ATPase
MTDVSAERLTRFREQVTTARRQAGYLQKDLAAALGLDTRSLSRKLHGAAQTQLSHQDVKQIIKTLAAWEAITTRAEAADLLALMHLKLESFSEEEWSSMPLRRLEKTPVSPRIPSPSPKVAADTDMEGIHRVPLPASTTSFIGREWAVQLVCERLRQAEVRLLTVLGAGGVGKTRLCLEVARRIEHEFTDGVCFVSLAAIRDPALVPSAVAQTLGLLNILPTGEAQTTQGLLHNALRNRCMLLVLDNFEQVLDAADFIADLLNAAPGLKVLVTSRAVLHLYGEHEVGLPPLECADPRSLPELVELAQYPAIRLFVERARAVQADFFLSEQNAMSLAQLCSRLDGLPLAIELAAARVKLFDPALLLEVLGGRKGQPGQQAKMGEDPLSFLRQQTRNVPVRQQTLLKTLDWSYQLLQPEEQRLLARLGIFLGDWTEAAAQAVCIFETEAATGGSQGGSLLDQLESLVNQSLVVHAARGEQTVPRFYLLEPTREYALRRLHQSGEWEQVRRRYVAYYRDLLERCRPDLLQEIHDHNTLKMLEHEQDNVRAALYWLVEGREAEVAQQLCEIICPFWEAQGQFSEAHYWIDAALRLGNDTSRTVRARLMLTKGRVAQWEGAYEQARQLFEESLALYEYNGDIAGKASALYHLGDVHFFQGDYDQAAPYYEACLELFQALGKQREYADTLGSLGGVLLFQGNLEGAQAKLSESLRLVRAEGQRGNLYGMLGMLSVVEMVQERPMQALAYIREALEIVQEVGLRTDVATTLAACGSIMGALGAVTYAAQVCAAAEALFERLGTSLPAVYLPLYSAALARTRAQVQEATWNQLWAQGRRLSQEQAVTLALEASQSLLHL